ncbi:GntR family transcriptional regulator [Streptacidiphilus monticola]|uniref:GntR family transcriptional regulator n=1 Tax=Streptacidiphilus monticola TaxID=2161674 RepID=A0ABW1FV92_9ACTN
MLIRLDPSSNVPPSEQIRAQVAAAAQSGEAPVGEKLPTVRGLAQELGVAANTVAKAYRELEAAGVVETRGRHGTVIAAAGDRSRAEAARLAAAYAQRAHSLGIPAAEAHAVVEAALASAYGA